MNRDDMNRDDAWEDIVRRLGGTEDQAKAEPAPEDDEEHEPRVEPLTHPGPRDYVLAEEIVEDFEQPEPKPLSTSNPRALLSWLGVIGSAFIWILAALGGWSLPLWLTGIITVGFFAGAISLFFLLPKTWADRDFFDDDDYGNGAKV